MTTHEFFILNDVPLYAGLYAGLREENKDLEDLSGRQELVGRENILFFQRHEAAIVALSKKRAPAGPESGR